MSDQGDQNIRSKEIYWKKNIYLTLLWWRPLSYRNQSIDLQNKSMDWFLYDRNLRLERIQRKESEWQIKKLFVENT